MTRAVAVNEYGERFEGVDAILAEINRDRSADWTPYTRRDWREGLELTGLKLLSRPDARIRRGLNEAGRHYLGAPGAFLERSQPKERE